MKEENKKMSWFKQNFGLQDGSNVALYIFLIVMAIIIYFNN
jgi:hypothetical protein